jgi:hypothetical protein
VREVALIELSLESPAIIVSKRGTGGFYNTTRHIPSSTILGAIARETILRNALEKRGNCTGLNSSKKKPPCNNCQIQKECLYTRIWEKRELRLSYALCGEYTFSDPPPIPNLQSLFKSKEEEKYADGLLQMALYKMALKGEAEKNILNKEILINKRHTKKESKDILVKGNNLSKLEHILINSPHVAINLNFKSSETGYLYSHALLSKTKFTAITIGEKELINYLKDSRISIGSAKSRGLGIAHLRVKESKSLEEYVKDRARQIAEGFKKIGKLVEKFYSKGYLGTFTGISPIPVVNDKPTEIIASRLNINPDQIKHISYKVGVHTRFEFGDGGLEPTFTLTNVIDSGYSGVFTIDGDLENISKMLAEIEINANGFEPWFGWICINHPVHYIGTTLGEI